MMMMLGRMGSAMAVLLLWMTCWKGVVSFEQHSSNWAVLVCASRDWRDYRHAANALSVYHTVKRLGIPDSHIVLMMPDDIACNARNALPAAVFNDRQRSVDLYGGHLESDYRGYEVTVENFIRVLTGRHESNVPRSKRMMSDSGSNILIYMTGHGGDEFLRFQSQEDLLAKDLADALAQMHEKQRYREILLMVDTCQASTLFSKIDAPNVFSIGSSIKGESSYAHHSDPVIGTSLIDRFTLATLNFFEDVDIHSNATLHDLLQSYSPHMMLSTVAYNDQNFQRKQSSVFLTDFFGHVAKTHIMDKGTQITKSPLNVTCIYCCRQVQSAVSPSNVMPYDKMQEKPDIKIQSSKRQLCAMCICAIMLSLLLVVIDRLRT